MITLYSTHCPRCRILEEKLDDKGIEYTIVTDIEEMSKLNIMSVPVLKINDRLLPFKEANDWVNEQEEAV